MHGSPDRDRQAGQPCMRSAASAGRAGHHSDATVVRWHPNSHLLATGSDDRTVRVWDARDGRAARVLVGHHGAVRNSGFGVWD